MRRNAKLYLNDILVSIELIREYTASLSFEEFSRDRKTIDAVIRNFEIIGEAVKNIPQEIKSKYDYNWKDVVGLRDVLSHGYFGVSVKIVWDIIKNELPGLEEKIREIMKNEQL